MDILEVEGFTKLEINYLATQRPFILSKIEALVEELEGHRSLMEYQPQETNSRRSVAKLTLGGRVMAYYPSLAKAALSVEGNSATIRDCIVGNRKSHMGYVWKACKPVKTCSACKKTKPHGLFYPREVGGTVMQSQCKVCSKKASKKRSLKNG